MVVLLPSCKATIFTGSVPSTVTAVAAALLPQLGSMPSTTGSRTETPEGQPADRTATKTRDSQIGLEHIEAAPPNKRLSSRSSEPRFVDYHEMTKRSA
jgi:hypothetical protein